MCMDRAVTASLGMYETGGRSKPRKKAAPNGPALPAIPEIKPVNAPPTSSPVFQKFKRVILSRRKTTIPNNKLPIPCNRNLSGRSIKSWLPITLKGIAVLIKQITGRHLISVRPNHIREALPNNCAMARTGIAALTPSRYVSKGSKAAPLQNRLFQKW